MMMGETDTLNLADADAGESRRNRAIAAVEQQRLRAVAQDAGVDGATEQVEIGGDFEKLWVHDGRG
jgi:hypothetical protein